MNFLDFLKSEDMIVIHIYNRDLCEKVANTLNKLIADNHIAKDIRGFHKILQPCYDASWFDDYEDKTCLANTGEFCSLELAKNEGYKIFRIEDVFWKDSNGKLYFNDEVNYVYLKNICKAIPEGKGDKNFMSDNGKDKEYTRVKAIYTEAVNRGILTVDEAEELLNRVKLVLDEVIL